jgi:hypothetical protein
MKRIGKIGKINLEANKKLKELFLQKQILTCEICGSDWALSWHHKHSRVWYRPWPEKLSEFSEVLLVCPEHHNLLQSDQRKSDYYFRQLRSVVK